MGASSSPHIETSSIDLRIDEAETAIETQLKVRHLFILLIYIMRYYILYYIFNTFALCFTFFCSLLSVSVSSQPILSYPPSG